MEIKKTLLIDNIDLVAYFSQEHFFDQLERRFDSTVILRGNSLITVGEKTEVESIEKIISELNFIYKKNGVVTEVDLKTLIDIAKSSDENNNPIHIDSKVIYHGFKDKIRVRNSKQEDYYKKCLNNDIETVCDELNRNMPWWKNLSEERQLVMANMCFNLGVTRLLKFKNFLAAMEKEDWDKAAVEMLDSRWAIQVGPRAIRLKDRVLKGG